MERIKNTFYNKIENYKSIKDQVYRHMIMDLDEYQLRKNTSTKHNDKKDISKLPRRKNILGKS